MPTVLVVDDAAFMRMRAGKLLSQSGYEVIEAENGLDALNKYTEYEPDLVLMDITMPVMDGLTAVREIRQVDPEAKIIMVSAMGQQAMVIEAIKLGAKDFIVKPYEPDNVLASVKKLIG
ncbi:MAG: response regulator [Bacillota bacterium]|nr:response regulator [Bacillota bacterium]HOK70287.1 response regulator [Bacillota bacterium]HOL51867.1 response regulator [Bacillota bacterium]HOO31040.1 response regulator [Bacillota bacterium]HPQ03172.1 response regulator [Bacillota bacterium]